MKTIYQIIWYTQCLLQFLPVYQEVFRRFDKDKNGTISLDNLEKVMKALGQEVTQEDVKAMIREYDRSGKACFMIDIQTCNVHNSFITCYKCACIHDLTRPKLQMFLLIQSKVEVRCMHHFEFRINY